MVVSNHLVQGICLGLGFGIVGVASGTASNGQTKSAWGAEIEKRKAVALGGVMKGLSGKAALQNRRTDLQKKLEGVQRDIEFRDQQIYSYKESYVKYDEESKRLTQEKKILKTCADVRALASELEKNTKYANWVYDAINECKGESPYFHDSAFKFLQGSFRSEFSKDPGKQTASAYLVEVVYGILVENTLTRPEEIWALLQSETERVLCEKWKY